jgi:hypothetical protein
MTLLGLITIHETKITDSSLKCCIQEKGVTIDYSGGSKHGDDDVAIGSLNFYGKDVASAFLPAGRQVLPTFFSNDIEDLI